MTTSPPLIFNNDIADLLTGIGTALYSLSEIALSGHLREAHRWQRHYFSQVSVT